MSAKAKTPSEWAKETEAPDGKPNFVPCAHAWQVDRYSWQHNAAAVRHGWQDHQMATSAEIELSRDDYLAALKAVADPKGTRIHEPALSPWCTATDGLAKAAGAPERLEANKRALNEHLTAFARATEAWEEKVEMEGPDKAGPPPELKPFASAVGGAA